MSYISDILQEAIRLDDMSGVLKQAVKFAESFKYSKIDMKNRKIVIPFDKGITEEEVMEPGMLGDWYWKNGFNIEFTVDDYEYTTQGRWLNRQGWNRQSGHKAYLRNRLIATITW